MKKFIKISIFILALFAIVSCDKKEEDVEDTGLFFDVVYQAASTREASDKGWVNVSGKMQMKFIQSTETQGTYIFHYENYSEPQFVYNACSGGFQGNFDLMTEAPTSPTSPVYDVNQPYTPDNSNASGTTVTTPVLDPNDPKSVAPIKSYQFALTITSRSLDPACRPESDKTVLLYRFKNGELILKSEYREIRMRPVLTSESAIN